MILRYTVDDFPVNSGVVHPPPPSPGKETNHGQLRGLRFQYDELREEDSGRGGPQQHSWGWEEGAQPWKGSHLLNEASTSQVQHLNSLQDAIFLSRIRMCFAVISQHLGKGVQVQTFGIALCWVSMEL